MFQYRTVNGKPAYLEKGIERDTPLSQQGSLGRLEKSGAVFLSDPGRMACLLTEPVSGTFVAANTLPDPMMLWSLSLPGGMSIRADGRLGLARVTVNLKENRINVDYATAADQVSPFMAKALVVSGAAKRPQVLLNGTDCTADCASTVIAGRSSFCIPLAGRLSAKELAQIPHRLEVTAHLSEHRAENEASLITDWMLAGAYPSSDLSGHDIAYPPESGIDLRAGWSDGTALQPWIAYATAGGPRELGTYAPGRSVNLSGKFARDDQAVGYAYTRLVSDAERDVWFLIGSDDAIKVWCNGALVHDHRASRAVTMDEDSCRVHLRKGTNDILVKITQGEGGWGFCLRVADELGAPVGEGVSVGTK